MQQRKQIFSIMLVAVNLALTATANGAEDYDHATLYDEFVAADQADGSEDGHARHLTSRLCARCHNAHIDEVMSSVHYTFRSENTFIEFPGGGEHGHIDRFSGLSGGDTATNYAYDDKDSGCGRCHVGRYFPGSQGEINPITGETTPMMNKVRDGIDCLVCHAKTYNGRKHTVSNTDALGNPQTYWLQDRSFDAVASIGKTKTENCLRCHDHPASPDERGTPFRAWNDVHIAEALEKGYNACTSCHTARHHKMVRGNYVADIFSSDYEVGSPENAIRCDKCHSLTPHDDDTVLAKHTRFIACQTCHVPWTSGVTYATWDADGQWRRYSRADEYSELDSKPYIKDGNLSERQLWEKYRFRPKYLWFNGRASYIGQPLGSAQDGLSKIYPFHPIASGLPVDTSGLRTTDVLDDATVQTALVGLGMMRPGDAAQATATAGLGILDNKTSDSSLSIAMQNILFNTPLVYSLDLQTLTQTSDMSLSINHAMKNRFTGTNFLGRLLGADNDTPLLSLFNDGHPGNSFATVKLPVGDTIQSVMGDNYPAFSFMTLAHGIRDSDQALTCQQCHDTAGNSVLQKNRFQVLDGLNAAGIPTYRSENNLTVLGLDPQSLSLEADEYVEDDDDDDERKHHKRKRRGQHDD